ncbi:hypothetical protein CY34DRAFT_777419 [Suillus luteus UH-Slu-Lm8-n1]|uniref:Uncharacterized protein n=1 Tax=Suillus luteus UH-Slu-Lm8-n1 TaxID=930992 RepID=A0A0D0AFK6_9AGAM|nr:hypothetical protein CY34DRAFT_777419 [Suillus luteus UH-Slu-Lm8-n1]
MSISSDTTPYSLQSYSTLPPQGGLCLSSPGHNINTSVQNARTESYPSRAPSSQSTSFRGSCAPIEEEEEEERRRLNFRGATGWLFPDHAASRHQRDHAKPSDWTLSSTPSFPSTSFIRRLGTLAREEDEWISMEPQSSLFSACDINASVPLPSAQAGPYPSCTPSPPSTSFIRSLCTLFEEGEEE